MFNNIDTIKADGFIGFETVRNLRESISRKIPNQAGVYFVMRLGDEPRVFLKRSVGGHFKGQDPTVSLSKLESNWVNDTPVIYMGKAGGPTSSATLQSRIKELLAFGGGKPAAHRGGRLMWQLKGSEDLAICWKLTPDDDPREIEKDLITQFKERYSGMRPFANLQD